MGMYPASGSLRSKSRSLRNAIFVPSGDHFAPVSSGGNDFAVKGTCSVVNSVGLLPSWFIVQSLRPRLARLRLRLLVKTILPFIFPLSNVEFAGLVFSEDDLVL